MVLASRASHPYFQQVCRKDCCRVDWTTCCKLEVEKVLVLVCNYVALDTIMIIQYRSKIPLGNRRKERLLLHHQSSENKALSLSLTYFQFDSVNLLKKEIRITVRISFPAFLTSYLWYSFYTNVSRGVMSRAGTFEDHLPVLAGRSQLCLSY